MKSKPMKNLQHQFKIVFDGEVEQIDVNVLISTLLNTTSVLNEINHELDPKQKLAIQIEPFAPGSFEIIYSLAPQGFIGELLTHITSADTLKYLATLVTVLSGVFTVKKFLKGKKPKSVETADGAVTITSSGGGTITVKKEVYNIYANNAVVNDGVSKTFRALEEHEQIKEFNILTAGNSPLVKIPRDDFRGMQEKNVLVGEDLEIVTMPDAKLSLHKIVFTQDNKWGFIYEGNKIGAFIRDREFFDKLDEHAFNIGDYFVAELRITRKYDPIVKAYLNDGYEVMRVKDHHKMPSQQKFKFPKK